MHSLPCFLLLTALLVSQQAPLSVAIDGTPVAPRTFNELHGVSRAVTPSDLGELIRDNLLEDLAPWRSRKLRAIDFLNLLHEIDSTWPEYRRNFIAIVAIRRNQFSWWAYPKARKWCTSRVEYAKQEFEKHVRINQLSFPDVLYVMNGYDKPLCPAGNCSAPIFSFTKPWTRGCTAVTATAAHANRTGVKADDRARVGCSSYDDILHPVMNHPFDTLVDYPWALKADKAFMRAGVYAAMAHNCSRVLLHSIAQSPEGRRWLDVGIYKNRHWRVRLKTVPPVAMEDHARYRYLLSTDGQAASWRLAKLLAINSVVLKWESDSIEHYYRSLVPGTHYLPIDQSSLFRVLDAVRVQAQASEAPAVTQAAQRFAFRFLSQASRAAYSSSALEHYKALFDDGLESLLDSLDSQPTLSMPGLLDLRLRLLSD